jgi:hypothetical protein
MKERIMKNPLILGSLVALLVGLVLGPRLAAADELMLAHMVYFSLEDRSGEAIEKLVASCNELLSGHEGTVYFSVGVLAEDLDRDVNDRDFDVALHLVFENKAAHDTYQTHPRHLKFIEENRPGLKKVRVFDSYLSASPDPQADRIPLPDPAAGFAGMVQGEIVGIQEGQIVLAISKVTQIWEHSKAPDPDSLIGKRVLVDGRKEKGEPVTSIARFIAGLQEGEEITIDVALREGETLTILELTEDQRERVREKE